MAGNSRFRSVLPTVSLIAGLLMILALSADLQVASASASPASPPPIDFVRVDGSTKEPKPPATSDPEGASSVPGWVLAAQRTLDDEAVRLTTAHGGDTESFKAAWTKRKLEVMVAAEQEAKGLK